MKKDLVEYYMNLPYKVEIVPDLEEGGYTALIPDLVGCFTCGETLGECMEMIEDAKRTWITATLEDGAKIPEPSNIDSYSGQFKLRIPKSLHKSLADHAREEGISMNQYILYLLSMNDAKYFNKK